jgi:predicted negative regulator of RcsB-dependent stress response
MVAPARTNTLPCYGPFVKGDEGARHRIQKLLVTGDNRLKQGVDPEKARESWEQALEVAREAGLEDAVRPLVEVRLNDLRRAPAEPRSAPPDS